MDLEPDSRKGRVWQRRVMERNFPIVGDGKRIWNFVYIEDAAAGLAASVSGPAGIYNLTDGTPDSLYYATQLRGVSNQKARQLLEFSPKPLEWLGESPKLQNGDL